MAMSHGCLMLNARFHSVLLNAARNRFLVRAIESIQKTLLILGPSTLEDAVRVTDAVREHGEIIAALQSHDGDAAEAAMRAHIEAAHRARLKHLAPRTGHMIDLTKTNWDRDRCGRRQCRTMCRD